MKGTYVVLVSMAGALVWFFWQRRHSRRRADISGDGEARSDHVAQETSIAAPDTGHSLESTFKPPSEQTGEAAREPDLEIQPAAAAEIEPDRQTEEISVAQLPPVDHLGQERHTTTPTFQAEEPVVPVPSGDAGVDCEAFPADITAVPGNGDNSTVAPREVASTAIIETAVDPHLVVDTPPAGTAAVSLDSSVLVEVDAGSGEAAAPAAVPPAVDAYAPKGPQRYRPPVQRPARPVSVQGGKHESSRAVPVEVLCDIRVHLTFERGGFCNFSLLPEHTPGLDEEVSVKSATGELPLLAQGDWYQDLQFPDIDRLLREGLELIGRLGSGQRGRWLLTGRDLYVLASHPRASGFVSTNRLALGRSHVVLCTLELLEAVEGVLSEAGCTGYTRIDQSYGVPPGWIALRGVAPAKAIPLGLGTDPFYGIKPAPDIEIELEGGLWFRNSVWVAGYPPRIKLLGQSDVPVRVLIDGKETQRSDDGCFTAQDYDLDGSHVVECEGLSCSKSYSIEEPPESWEQWPAHSFGPAAMCGPLVQLNGAAASARIVTVPMSNPVLLGARPGEMFFCSRRNVAHWTGYVPFAPIWALPAYPLTSNKASARIVQISVAPVLSVRGPGAVRWSNAILDAGRKGLRIEDESPASKALWSAYKKAARSIWRSAR
ncbi:MAG: hypothetical protein LAP86_20480 [Acidobacteriia bacterium]|nr:hypothetical protein [Terriglobia bacterium]